MERDPFDDELHLPEALQRDLRTAFGTQVRIPAALDEALYAAARRRQLRPVWRRALPIAAAAALLLALPLLLRGPGTLHEPAPVAREDFDGNGRVDVRDAFRLQLALQRGDAVPATFDLDGDGRVDRADVDRIAAAAVRVHG
jgi:predicted nucleic acid-binding protein